MAMVETREPARRRKPRPVNGATELENCSVCTHRVECWGEKPEYKYPANAKCIRFNSVHKREVKRGV